MRLLETTLLASVLLSVTIFACTPKTEEAKIETKTTPQTAPSVAPTPQAAQSPKAKPTPTPIDKKGL